ncbi:hypothetical protein D3C86_2160940 [compost metagenome]
MAGETVRSSDDLHNVIVELGETIRRFRVERRHPATPTPAASQGRRLAASVATVEDEMATPLFDDGPQRQFAGWQR